MPDHVEYIEKKHKVISEYSPDGVPVVHRKEEEVGDKEKSCFWRVELDPVVIEFDVPVTYEYLQVFLDDKIHPHTLGSAGWTPITEPEEYDEVHHESCLDQYPDSGTE